MRLEVFGIVPCSRQLTTCGDERERTIGAPPFIEGADRISRNVLDVLPVLGNPFDALCP